MVTALVKGALGPSLDCPSPILAERERQEMLRLLPSTSVRETASDEKLTLFCSLEAPGMVHLQSLSSKLFFAQNHPFNF